MMKKGLELQELVNLEEWQKIQDSFSDALEVSLRTISLEGRLLGKTSRPCRFCTEVLPGTPHHNTFCSKCLLRGECDSQIDIKTPTSFKCPFGLEVYVVPIKAVSSRIVAYLIVGPVILTMRKAISECTKDAEKLGIPLDQLLDALIEINVFTYSKIYSVNQLLEYTFSHMAQAGYHKKRLGEIAPEVLEMDPLFSRYYEEKVLNALLNACSLAFDVDSGSVMTIDKNTNKLYIKVSQKLDEDVVNKTSLKIGEGIAGYAVATAQPIILPKDEGKSEIFGKLKRKYIKSSMVIPFSKGDDPDMTSVINLNVVRKDKDFSDKDIALAQQLIKLASIALVPLQPNLDTK